MKPTPYLRASIHCHPSHSLKWVRDRIGILVFNGNCQNYAILTGWEADLWDWCSIGLTGNEIIEQTSARLEGDAQEAAECIHLTLEKWQQSGMIIIEDD
jgi:hypothetical protein